MSKETPKPMTVRDRLKSKSKEKTKPKSQEKRIPNAIGKLTGNRSHW